MMNDDSGRASAPARKPSISFESEEIMRSATRRYAEEQVRILDRTKAEGRFDRPALGPLGRDLKAGAKWTDEYPAWPKYAVELEQLLEFAKRNGSFEAYRRQLRLSDDRRNSALMELRAALHLGQSGFNILEWFPKGDGTAQGEFLVEGPSKERVFVEVKSPSWKGEVFQWQGKARSTSQLARVKQAKYISGEGGAVGPWMGIRFAIDKAYKEQEKFRGDVPNLLVVADDMRVSLAHGTELQAFQALYSPMRTDPGYFTDARYERLGGVGIFWLDQQGGKSAVEYHMKLFLNGNALPATALPADMQEVFSGQILKA